MNRKIKEGNEMEQKRTEEKRRERRGDDSSLLY
jgi:hypothetical protein